jgi:hypothetical protein
MASGPDLPEEVTEVVRVAPMEDAVDRVFLARTRTLTHDPLDLDQRRETPRIAASRREAADVFRDRNRHDRPLAASALDSGFASRTWASTSPERQHGGSAARACGDAR